MDARRPTLKSEVVGPRNRRAGKHPILEPETAVGGQAQYSTWGDRQLARRAAPLMQLKKEDPARSTHAGKRRLLRFGRTSLPLLEESDRRAYRPLEGHPIDHQQRCLLDAVWTSRTQEERLKACCSLQYYFAKIMQPPVGKNFSYYALTSESVNGVYPTWLALLEATGRAQGKKDWKGFYSFHEAVDYLAQILNPGVIVEYEVLEPRDGPYIEAQK